MKKQQWFLVGGSLVLCFALFFFGKTVPPKKPVPAGNSAQSHEHQSVTFESLLSQAKARISPEQAQRLTMLENAVVRGDIKEQHIHVYHRLARFWADSAHIFEPYAYYTGEAAKLENSEKSLT